MDSQKSHMMPEEENARLSSQERKIYPLTGDLIEEADQYLVERLRQRRLKKGSTESSKLGDSASTGRNSTPGLTHSSVTTDNAPKTILEDTGIPKDGTISGNR